MTAFTENTTATPLQVQGIGLITGKPVTVTIHPAEPGHGIVFYMDGASAIPARLPAVVHTDRGVTLANADGRMISIVEHFLCAASLTGLSDLRVEVHGAPELPILDGSARDWLDAFESSLVGQPVSALEQPPASPKALSPLTGQSSGRPLRNPHVNLPTTALPAAIFYRHNEDICLYAIPDTHFKVTYSVDFNHPELRNQWVHWNSRADARELVSDSVTFGYLSELPALQAKGLALGVTPENSLGLIETGGYSRPLRHDAEPVYHKVLDLIGDLTLMGINPLTLKAHVFAVNAGHGSHTAFARKLLAMLQA